MTNPDYTHVTFVLDNSASMSHLRAKTIEGFNAFINKQKDIPGKLTFSLYQFHDPQSRFYTISNSPPSTPKPMVNPWPLPIQPSYTWATNTAVHTAGPPNVVPILTSWPVGVSDNLGSSVNASAVLMGQPSLMTPTVIRCTKPEQVRTTYELMDSSIVPYLSIDNYSCDTMTPLLDTMGYGLDRTGELLAGLAEEHRPVKVVFVILTDGGENHSRAYNHEGVTAKIKHQTDVYGWQFVFLGANQDAIQVGGSYGISPASSMNYAATGQSVTSTFNAMSASVGSLRTAGIDISYDASTRAAVMDGTLGS